jgi:hypothetical protein
MLYKTVYIQRFKTLNKNMEKKVTQTEPHYRMDFRDVLLYLGYDLSNEVDLTRLCRNAAWVNTMCEKEAKKKIFQPGVRVAIITTIISTILTGVITWLTK